MRSPARHHPRALLWSLGLGACLSLAGCKQAAKVECEHDIDCDQLCHVCDQSTKRCVPSGRCEDLQAGLCAKPTDCDPLLERCVDGICVPAFDAGSPDGGDDDPGQCPDLSGVWDLATDCAGLGEASGLPISQMDCDLAFALGNQLCTGQLDPSGRLTVDCAGHDLDCHGQVAPGEPFAITCASGCQWGFAPVTERIGCTRHAQATCADADLVCDLTCLADGWRTACAIPNPDGNPAGLYCDPGKEIACLNSMCIDGVCLAPCLIDAHCADFPGTSCQTRSLAKGACAAQTYRVCAPEVPDTTWCGQDADCPVEQRCSFVQLEDRVVKACRPIPADSQPPGGDCRSPDDCQSRLCVCAPNELCDQQAGTCSRACLSDLDCFQGTLCAAMDVPDLLGRQHDLDVCLPDPASCGRDADCEPGRSCQSMVAADLSELISTCNNAGNGGVQNSGAACIDGSQCYSLWCWDNPAYCASLCLTDADCPTLDPGVACATDSDCPADHLCEAGACLKIYECWTFPFSHDDLDGNEVWDLVNACYPRRRPCGSNDDCAAGLVCRGNSSKDANDVFFGCSAPNPGGGPLGTDCQLTGSAACATNICVFDNEAGLGNELWYCSQICQTDEDCGDPEAYHCEQVSSHMRPGVVVWTGICLVTQEI